MTLRNASLFLLLLLALAPALANFNPIYARDHVNIFPAADAAAGNGIVVDGELADWKPEAFILLYPEPDLQEVFALRIAFAYDEQGLLMAARFTDTTPLINHNDPTVDPFRGWNGDALQFRVIASTAYPTPFPADKLNIDQVSHMTLWYFTDKSQPVFDIRYGMDFHAPVTLIDAASGFRYAKGDRYWTMEGRIPWARLNAPAPQPGTSWRMTLQALYGNQSGLQHNFFECISSPGFHYQRPDGWGNGYFVKHEEVAARFAEQANFLKRRIAREKGEDPDAYRISIPYNNPAAGYVSMAICTKDGQIVRTLLAKAKRDAGALVEAWDGLDDDGQPVAAGEYTIKALSHPGITGKFIAAVHNSGQPAWVNADGTGGWGGDHAPPIGAISDTQGNSYLMWTFNEGGSFLIRVDATGKKKWGAAISWGDFAGGATALTYDTMPDGKGVVYVAKDGAGKEQGYGGLFAFDAETGKRVNFPNGKGVQPLTKWDAKLADDRMETGTPRERMLGGKYNYADLGANLIGLATGPTRIFAAFYFENKIVAYDRTTFEAKETFTLPSPGYLVYDAAHKRLFVISGSTVVTLDPASGKVTPFITADLEYPFGLALDGKGNLYVSVRGRQMQVRVFSPTGAYLRAIGTPGGRPWEGKFNPNGMLMPSGISVDARGQLWVMEMDATPKRQSLWNASSGKFIKEFFGSAAYAPMMAPDPEKPEQVYIHNTRFIVDYAKGTVKPDATVYRAGLHGDDLPGPQAGYGFMGATFEVQYFMGKPFAFDGHGGVYRVEKDRFVPVLYLGQGRAGMPGLAKDVQPGGQAVVWKDLNGNALIDAGEVTIVTKTVGDLGNHIAQFGAAFLPGAEMLRGGRIFRPTGLDKMGVPIYPAPEQAEPIITGKSQVPGGWLDVWPSLSSNWTEFYTSAASPKPAARGVYDGGFYRFNRNGDVRWRYARVYTWYALNAPLSREGDFAGALRILGEVELPKANGGEVVGIGCYRGYYGFLNEDGLYIDRFGTDTGRGPNPDFDTFFIENFSGYFFQHPKTKKIYLFGGTQEGRIIELQGWDKIVRFDAAAVKVTEADRDKVAASLAARQVPEVLTQLAVKPATPVIDGAIGDWDAKALGVIPLDETAKAIVSLAHDETNLYALFDVNDDTPWKNAAKDWHFLFKGGDTVDIQLGPVTPNSKEQPRKPQPGDVRVMIGPGATDGEFNVVGMWQAAAPAGVAAEPLLYKSPVAEEPFAHVARITTATCKLVRTEKGYILEAAIPWAALGMTPPAKGARLMGDLGVVLSDAAGAQSARRCYLFNKDTGVMNDIPSEVRVQSSNWGLLNLE